jgi:hypothetical protein
MNNRTFGSPFSYDGIVFDDSPYDFAAGQLSSLYSYEATFGVRQIDGYYSPASTLGQTIVSQGALDGTSGTLTAAGLTAFPELEGPIPVSTGKHGYASVANPGAPPLTPLIENSTGDILAAVYQHPSTDAQANVAELALNFNYNASQLQWELLAPDLIAWVTQDVLLGEYRNYVEMDIDDSFTPDDSWTPDATNPLDNGSLDYNEADSLRMQPADVDTPYLDVGCATENYIEAELNENSSSIAAAPGSTLGTGGLGITESTDVDDALGYEDPQVFVPGNHSGLADLVPGNPAKPSGQPTLVRTHTVGRATRRGARRTHLPDVISSGRKGVIKVSMVCAV